MITDGWQCPRCRRVWSPLVSECEPCNEPIVTRHDHERGCPICGRSQYEHTRTTPAGEMVYGCPPPEERSTLDPERCPICGRAWREHGGGPPGCPPDRSGPP